MPQNNNPLDEEVTEAELLNVLNQLTSFAEAFQNKLPDKYKIKNKEVPISDFEFYHNQIVAHLNYLKTEIEDLRKCSWVNKTPAMNKYYKNIVIDVMENVSINPTIANIKELTRLYKLKPKNHLTIGQKLKVLGGIILALSSLCCAVAIVIRTGKPPSSSILVKLGLTAGLATSLPAVFGFGLYSYSFFDSPNPPYAPVNCLREDLIHLRNNR